MSSRKRNCIKNMSHEWETIDELPSHIVKQCWRCKVKTWKPRRDKVDYDRVVAVLPIRV